MDTGYDYMLAINSGDFILLTLMVDGREDMNLKEAKAGEALVTLAATRLEARENIFYFN